MSEREQEPESDYTQVSVPDEELPEDLQANDANPLAGRAADDDAELQGLGDPHIEGLEHDDDDNLTMPDTDGGEESHRGSDADADSSGAS